METIALRMYGASDLRVESFELPEIKDNEILALIISDSLCMSSYKAAKLGKEHKRIPDDVAENPIILGHEFCGQLVKVGKKWQDKYKAGDKFVIQPALNYKGHYEAPGYSFGYIGGCAKYVIIPEIVVLAGCLLPYSADAYFYGSLAEPYSCAIGSFKEFFHTTPGVHRHRLGVKKGGKLAIIGGGGPMGFAALDYIVHCDRHPGLVVLCDIDQGRLDRMASLITVEDAKKNGVNLVYLNTATCVDPGKALMEISGNTGYDDVLSMAPVRSVVELSDDILGFDGCLSFFAGPMDTNFKAEVNFYDVHYNFSHIVGTVGGNAADMVEAIKMMEQGKLLPQGMVTHIGGLDCSAEATLNLPQIGGGKKIIYTTIKLPLTAIDEFEEKGKTDPLFAKLAEITKKNNGLWSKEAEDYLLENSEKI